MGTLFLDLGLLLLAAFLGGLAAHVLRQPPVVGYVLAGILVGSATPGSTIRDPQAFELFAQIGVVLLLFSAGLEFSLSSLVRVRRVALYGTPVGIVAIVLLTTGLGHLFGWSLTERIVVGASISFCSTTVLFKFLQDRHELSSLHGRILIGMSLVQDLIVVLVIALLPTLRPGGRPQAELVLQGILQAAVTTIPLLWLARRVVPGALARVAHTRSMELFLLAAVALAIGTAAFTAQMGLSLALGAFLAGLVVSESEFAHEALARVLPIRDVFVAVFFVSMGMLLRPASMITQVPVIASLVALVVIGNALVWTAVVRGAGYPPRIALLCGLGLSQVGEFSYLVAGSARAQEILRQTMYEAILTASLVTILINANVFRRRPAWLEGLLQTSPYEPREVSPDKTHLEGHVVLCGFGRVGREVAEALDFFGVPYVAVDLDPQALEATRAVFGDATNPLALRRAGAERARLAVVTIPDFQAAYRCVRALRELAPDLPILARVHQSRHRALLLEAGATEVIQPEVEAALTIVRHSLDWLGIAHEAGRAYLKQARRHWPEALRAEGFAEELQAREVLVRSRQLTGQSLQRARLGERTGAIVVSLTRSGGEQILNPRPEEVLRPGDRLLVIGDQGQLDALERLCQGEQENR